MTTCYKNFYYLIEEDDMVMVCDAIKMLRNFCDKEGYYPRNTGGYYSVDDATNFLTKYSKILENNND